MSISLGAALEVRSLLEADHLSHRKIARRTGVSRGTVNTIAAGKWHGWKRAERPEVKLGSLSEEITTCDECGKRVHLPRDGQPCVACRTLSAIAAGLAPSGDSRKYSGLAPLDLEPEHEARYLRLRAEVKRLGRSLEAEELAAMDGQSIAEEAA